MTNSRPPSDPKEVWRLSGEPAKEALDMLLRAANLLLIAHAAAIFGILNLLKDQSQLVGTHGFRLFLVSACLGFLSALVAYGMIFMERINWLRSKPVTLAERPDFRKSTYMLILSFLVLALYISAIALVATPT